MHAPQHSVNTARSRPSSGAHAHGRSHSLSDPRSLQTGASVQPPFSTSSTPAVQIRDATSASDWQCAAAISPLSAQSSPSPDSSVNATIYAQSFVAPRAASPQGMVSSGSPKSDPTVAAYASIETANPTSARTTGKKSSIDRNRKPCGACSDSKRKCKLIPDVPNLCERCRNHGLTECPPYVPWSSRKANVAESGSLSPVDVDEGAFSSRSASPSYFGPGRSPVGYCTTFQNQIGHGVHPDMTTQEWVQDQAQNRVTPGSSNVIEQGAYETYHPPNAHHSAQLAALQSPQQCMQSNVSPNPPLIPVCHVCQTPYNEYLMLNYALAQLQATMPSPPYDLDQGLLQMYGHVPQQDDSYNPH